MRIHDLDGLHDIRRTGLMKILPGKPRIGVGMGTCGIGNGAREVYHALEEALKKNALDAQLTPVGCFGFCAAEPLVNVHIPGFPLVVLGQVTPADAAMIVQAIAANLALTILLALRILYGLHSPSNSHCRSAQANRIHLQP